MKQIIEKVNAELAFALFSRIISDVAGVGRQPILQANIGIRKAYFHHHSVIQIAIRVAYLLYKRFDSLDARL